MLSAPPELGLVATARTVSGREAATEPPGMGLWRVLAVATNSRSPLVVSGEAATLTQFESKTVRKCG
jgi:hypothetical protein